MTEATPASPSPPSPFAGSDWFDPLEEAVRGQVRSVHRGAAGGGAGSRARPRPLRASAAWRTATAMGTGRASWSPPSARWSCRCRGLVCATRTGEREWKSAAPAGLQAAQPSRRGADRPGLSRRDEHPPGAASVGQACSKAGSARTWSAGPGSGPARPGRLGSSVISPARTSSG